jgi:hypothetical protein
MRFHRLAGAALLAAGLLGTAPLAAQPPAAPPNVERRLAAVEQQLNQLLKEMKAIRAERKGKDVPGPAAAEVKVFRLKHADVKKVEGILQKVYPDKGAPRLRFAAAPGNSLVLAGPPTTLAEVQALLTAIDVDEGKLGAGLAVPELKVFRLKHADPAQMEKLILKIFQDKGGPQMRVAAVPPHSLVVYAPVFVLFDVAKLLSQIDAPEEGKREGGKKKPAAPPPDVPRPPGAVEGAKRRAALAAAEASQWRDRVAWAERMAARGYLRDEQVQADRARWKAAEDALARARKELEALTREPAPK